MSMPPLHPTAVLVAGTGRHLDALAQHAKAGRLPLDLRLCISHKAGVLALDHAQRHGIESLVVDPERQRSPEELSELVFQALEERGVTTALLAGFLRLLPIPEAWEGRVLNISPLAATGLRGQGILRDPGSGRRPGAGLPGGRLHGALRQQRVRLGPHPGAASV